LNKFGTFGITVTIPPWMVKQIGYTKSGQFYITLCKNLGNTGDHHKSYPMARAPQVSIVVKATIIIFTNYAVRH
jgi:hypothetical protein